MAKSMLVCLIESHKTIWIDINILQFPNESMKGLTEIERHKIKVFFTFKFSRKMNNKKKKKM